MTATVGHAPRAPIARVFGPLAGLFNPLVVRVAGSRQVPLYAIVRHRGRRSGRVYATPVAVAHGDGVLFVPLPFGTTADWLRNVLSAGGCDVRWNGAEHRMRSPEVVDADEAAGAFNAIERVALRALGIRAVLRLRFAV